MADQERLELLREHGYRVERFGDSGWTLLDVDGAALMIGGHGCVAPTKREAVAEGVRRVAQDHPDGTVAVPLGRLEVLERIAAAAAVYVHEFDHLCHAHGARDYPEQADLKAALEELSGG